MSYLYNVLGVVEVGKAGIQWDGRQCRRLAGPRPVPPAPVPVAAKLQSKTLHFKYKTSSGVWGPGSSPHFFL